MWAVWQTVYTLNAEHSVWSGSTRFAHTCLTRLLGLLREVYGFFHLRIWANPLTYFKEYFTKLRKKRNGKQWRPWSVASFLGVDNLLSLHLEGHITRTRLFKYIENITSKTENFQIKNWYISAQNTDCGYSLEPPRRGGSNEYQQSIMFLSKNKKNNVYPCKLHFHYIKVGFKGVKII